MSLERHRSERQWTQLGHGTERKEPTQFFQSIYEDSEKSITGNEASMEAKNARYIKSFNDLKLQGKLEGSSLHWLTQVRNAFCNAGIISWQHKQRRSSKCKHQGPPTLWTFYKRSQPYLRSFGWSRLRPRTTAYCSSTFTLRCYKETVVGVRKFVVTFHQFCVTARIRFAAPRNLVIKLSHKMIS